MFESYGIIGLVVWLGVVFLSISWHEFAHGWMANVLGDDTAEREGRLTMNPISHIDPFGSIILPAILYFMQAPFLFAWAKPVPYNPYNLKNPRWGGALVAAAGPLANLLIAVFAAIILRLEVFVTNPRLVEFFSFLAIINIALAIFNLIPVPPLDGSKLLAAVLPEVGRRMFDYLERFGPMLVFVLLLFVFNLIAPILSQVIFAIFRFLVGG